MKLENLKPFLFILPAMLIMAFGLFYPLIFSGYTSFFDWRLGYPTDTVIFSGFDNYIWLLTDPNIINAFWVTAKFTVISVIFELLCGISLALLLDRSIQGMNLIRTILMMPMMIAPLVVGLMWQYLYNSQFGVINKILVSIGLFPIEWLSSSDWGLFSVIIADIWQWTPFIFILALASLQSISKSMIDAARINGANWWQIIYYIKLPLMKPVIIIAALLRLIDSLKVFEVIYIMTGGGPAGSTETVSMAIYNQAFINFNIGRAAALSNLYLGSIIIIGLGAFFIRKIVMRYRLGQHKKAFL